MNITTQQYATIWSIWVLHGSALTNSVRWTTSAPRIILSSWISVSMAGDTAWSHMAGDAQWLSDGLL